MRQASGDLFPSDSPIPASQMIGRRDDVREIATRLEAGTHLIVAGPRRTGKTSVCEAALTRARRRGAYVAKLDLFRVSDAAELAEALAAAVIANRSAAHRLLRR
ncbi:MAG: ATP-binding protein, partial [Thermoleophilaceae bacterium]|nr:ATP-binding protein [Thermoleophilaceae bacterium]